MKKRLPYLIAFAVLLSIEILIALFVRDTFIRPFVGDALVTVLLCCLVRAIIPDKIRLLPIWVFLFSAGVELVQLANLPQRLGLEHTVIGIMLGSTFDLIDLLCYLAGCLAFWAIELLFRYMAKRRRSAG